jgi:hypothetical protein
MLNLTLGVFVLLSQLIASSGSDLPQIMSLDAKAAATAKAGRKSDVTVNFSLLKGYVINRNPPITLKLTETPGVKIDQMSFVTTGEDPKSKDEYYVDLPTIKVPLTAAKAGKYEIPGKLTYFFCSKADGFCARQVYDVKIPLTVN